MIVFMNIFLQIRRSRRNRMVSGCVMTTPITMISHHPQHDTSESPLIGRAARYNHDDQEHPQHDPSSPVTHPIPEAQHPACTSRDCDRHYQHGTHDTEICFHSYHLLVHCLPFLHGSLSSHLPSPVSSSALKSFVFEIQFQREELEEIFQGNNAN